MATKYYLRKIFSLKNLLIWSAVLAGLVFVGVKWGPALWAFFQDTDHIKSLVHAAGPLGPIIFVILQAFQTIFAPIPGNVVGAVGGVAFGWWGLPLTVIGAALGMAVVIAISRKFGRPLLERLFNKDKVKKLDWLLDHPAAEMVLFLIFLFPFMPDDIVGYLAGLTKIRFRTLMIISVVGKLPMQALNNFLGAKLMDDNWWVVLIVLAIVALMALLIFLKRRWLTGFIQTDNHIQYLKNSLKRKNKVKSKNATNNHSK